MGIASFFHKREPELEEKKPRKLTLAVLGSAPATDIAGAVELRRPPSGATPPMPAAVTGSAFVGSSRASNAENSLMASRQMRS